MSWAKLDIEGFGELEKNLRGMRGFVDSDKVVDSLLRGAQTIKRSIKGRAPRGPTGNLRRAIKAKKFKKQRRGDPAAYITIDRHPKRGAPHAHLVEFGVKRRTPKEKQFLKFEIDGKTIFTKQAKKIEAHPFWRPGVDASKNAAGKVAGARIVRELERAAARKQLHRYARTIG